MEVEGHYQAQALGKNAQALGIQRARPLEVELSWRGLQMTQLQLVSRLCL